MFLPIYEKQKYRYNRYIVISCYVSTDREPYLFIQVSLYLEVQGIVNKNGTTANLRLSFNESLKKKNGEKMLFYTFTHLPIFANGKYLRIARIGFTFIFKSGYFPNTLPSGEMKNMVGKATTLYAFIIFSDRA